MSNHDVTSEPFRLQTEEDRSCLGYTHSVRFEHDDDYDTKLGGNFMISTSDIVDEVTKNKDGVETAEGLKFKQNNQLDNL